MDDTLSLMLYPELLKNREFLDSKEWKLYLLLKSLCEYFLATEKSDHQIDLQTDTLHSYLKIRLSLIDDSLDVPNVISPKHIFTLHYNGLHK